MGWGRARGAARPARGPFVGRLVAIGEAVHGALDRSQRLAVPVVRLDVADLVAQLAHALGQTRIAPLLPAGAGHLMLDLIEQRHQFAAQRLPFALLRLLRVVVRLRLWKSAGHGSFPST